MQIVAGDFILPNRSLVALPDNCVINNGWGELGSVYIVGELSKPLPSAIQLAWFSFAENRFFSIVRDLNAARIHELFTQGFTSPVTQEQTTFTKIVVGLAPEGGVSIWVANEGVVLEVDAFQGSHTDISWTSVIDNPAISRDEYVQSIYKEAVDISDESDSYPPETPGGIWDRSRERYEWQPLIVGTTRSKTWVRYLNGEREYFRDSESAIGSNRRARPREILFAWWNGKGDAYNAVVTLSEVEVTALFERITEARPNERIELIIEASASTIALSLALKSGSVMAPMRQYSAKFYSG